MNLLKELKYWRCWFKLYHDWQQEWDTYPVVRVCKRCGKRVTSFYRSPLQG